MTPFDSCTGTRTRASPNPLVGSTIPSTACSAPSGVHNPAVGELRQLGMGCHADALRQHRLVDGEFLRSLVVVAGHSFTETHGVEILRDPRRIGSLM